MRSKWTLVSPAGLLAAARARSDSGEAEKGGGVCANPTEARRIARGNTWRRSRKGVAILATG